MDLEGDATIALITVPLGLALVFSKQMLVVNEYYLGQREAGRKWQYIGKYAQRYIAIYAASR